MHRSPAAEKYLVSGLILDVPGSDGGNVCSVCERKWQAEAPNGGVRMTRVRRLFPVILAIGLTACGSSSGQSETGVTPLAEVTPETPAFDLALVKSHFTDQCIRPPFDVEYACDNMQIEGMTADGSILNVPTQLDPSAGRDGRADVVCHFLATVHYGAPNGEDLGYDTIGVLDVDGSNLTTCKTVAP